MALMGAARLDPQLGYVPLIPEPFWIRSGWWILKPKMQCQCCAIFRSRTEYETHFALNHIQDD
jgi:hypothetical protein